MPQAPTDRPHGELTVRRNGLITVVAVLALAGLLGTVLIYLVPLG